MNHQKEGGICFKTAVEMVIVSGAVAQNQRLPIDLS